jgi:hypothetical protein
VTGHTHIHTEFLKPKMFKQILLARRFPVHFEPSFHELNSHL